MPDVRLNLSSEQFSRAFPFHFVLDEDLRVRQIGSVLRKICPSFVDGAHFMGEFHVERPILPETAFATIDQHSNAMFVLQNLHTPLRLRGEFVVQGVYLFFLGSPWVTDVADVSGLGITLKDFAIHDPITDLLFLIQSKNKAVADAQKFASILKQARDEISAINQTLELRVAERTAQLESANKELQRSNDELETFAYVASHDLQEPLRSVAGFVQLLEERYKDRLDADAQRFIGFAVDGTLRMHQLIRDLLTYSRAGIKDQRRAAVDCNEVLNQALAALHSACLENGAKVTYDPLPIVFANATELKLVFQNVIGNSIKYRSEVAPQIHISVEKSDDAWVFAVQDNGIGIDPKYHEKVFVIFQRLHGRTERPGTGLGLAICKKIIERHGGRMWVKSELGKGATFYFTVPEMRAENEHHASDCRNTSG